MTQETVVVPDIGGSEAAEVVEILVSVGDSVDLEQGLLVLESDKASMEIPSTAAGTVVEVLAKEGDEIGEGAPVAVIETAAGASAASTDEADAESPAAADESAPAEPPAAAVDSSEAPAPAAAASMDVPVPDIGTDDAVDVVEVSVAVGDSIDEGDTLIVLESDKASMEVPSPAAGVVEALRVEEGQQVSQGDPILVLKSSGSVPAPAAMPASVPAPAKAPQAAAPSTAAPSPGPAKATATPTDKASGASDVYAGPAVRQLAREFGVALEEVSGSGPRGRLLKEDLHEYVKRRLSAPASAVGSGIPVVPEVDFSKFGPVDVVQRSKIDKVTAANMQRSWLNAPHVTQFDDADITEMEAFRKSLKAEAEKRGTRLTPLPFLLKACAVALARHEKINASLSEGGESLTFKRYIHIGMAVDTPAGLVVPVIRDVDQKSLWDIAVEVLDMAARARDRKLKPAEMQGGSFTISSLGGIGGRGFTPIVNVPEVAILGVSRAQTQPVWDGGSFQPRLQLPLSLSYDHRVVNGGDAGRFLTDLCELLGDIRKLLL